MSISVNCQCGKRFRTQDQHAGRRATCPACGHLLTIPQPHASKEPPAPLPTPSRGTDGFWDEVDGPVVEAEGVDESHLQDESGDVYAIQSRYDLPPEDRAMLVGNQYVASNPGRMNVNLLKYWLAFPFWPSLWAVGLIVSIGFALSVHYVWIAAVIFFVTANLIFWGLIYEQFRHGCVCPAKLVSADEQLVAVFDDLGMDGRSRFVIKIVRQPVGMMVGGPFATGDQLAAVALYRGKPERDGRWRNVYPIVAHCVVFSKKKVDRVMRSIAPGDWEALDAALAQVQRPYRPGLYPVSLGLQ